MTEPALILVCKKPAPGIGKQRLTARLGIETTQKVADALLACALEDACDWPGPVVIAPANVEDVEWARALSAPVTSPVTVVPQGTGNLGQRLNALDQTLRAQGMKQLVFIGSDSPGLDSADYATTREALQHADIVLIPARDGGVVLMANRYTWPDLSPLPWSSDQLGAALINACRNARQTVKTLRPGTDVDEMEDLVRLVSLLQRDSRPARCALLELTQNIISTLKIANA
ncbi:MAG: DUF2064 domain-containing protein [Nitrosomonas sp.]|uniref:TIGR04282 family arsenosugar biosynthesis glycosyltransferase n=1 Tax=Nitrosomonas sp. TaxID=42353 RepID=UPI002732E119|nr:DUF2064 domain-containing protein [Nitrosomonas sp.]MDP3663362.1 DUF2064 domain-containing protein [Nitrosomonas sp.]MDZ4107932.1 DUF2064 domain-containing protein [Nitrosomonas sp.]